MDGLNCHHLDSKAPLIGTELLLRLRNWLCHPYILVHLIVTCRIVTYCLIDVNSEEILVILCLCKLKELGRNTKKLPPIS